MSKYRLRVFVLCSYILMMMPVAAHADAAAEMARKLQNPLANIKAIMTDNAIGFDAGEDEGTSYGFQIQPVYAIDMPDKGFTFIPRAVIPVLGLEPGTRVPPIGIDGNPSPANGDSVWGLGDSLVCSSSLHRTPTATGSGVLDRRYRLPRIPKVNCVALTGVPEFPGSSPGTSRRIFPFQVFWATSGRLTVTTIPPPYSACFSTTYPAYRALTWAITRPSALTGMRIATTAGRYHWA
jgi:hypothetical protein